jgi:hypothetical protein
MAGDPPDDSLDLGATTGVTRYGIRLWFLDIQATSARFAGVDVKYTRSDPFGGETWNGDIG